MKKYSPKKNSVSAVIITVFSAVLFPLFTLEKNSLITATENLSQYSERNLFLLEARDFEVVFIVYRIPCLWVNPFLTLFMSLTWTLQRNLSLFRALVLNLALSLPSACSRNASRLPSLQSLLTCISLCLRSKHRSSNVIEGSSRLTRRPERTFPERLPSHLQCPSWFVVLGDQIAEETRRCHAWCLNKRLTSCLRNNNKNLAFFTLIHDQVILDEQESLHELLETLKFVLQYRSWTHQVQCHDDASRPSLGCSQNCDVVVISLNYIIRLGKRWHEVDISWEMFWCRCCNSDKVERKRVKDDLKQLQHLSLNLTTGTFGILFDNLLIMDVVIGRWVLFDGTSFTWVRRRGLIVVSVLLSIDVSVVV